MNSYKNENIELDCMRIRQLYNGKYSIFFISLACSLLISYILKDSVSKISLMIWNASFFLSLLIRGYFIKKFLTEKKETFDFSKYENYYALGIFVSTMIFYWGIFIFFPSGMYLQQSFIATLTGGLCAGALFTYGTSFKTVLIYICIGMGTIMIKTIQEGSGLMIPLLLGYLFYVAALYRGAIEIGKNIRSIIEMKINSETLLTTVLEQNKELLEANDLLEDKNKIIENNARLATVGEMSASLVHEINNPITIIYSYVERSLSEITKPNFETEKIQKYLNKIQDAIRRVTIIIKGLRNLARDGAKDEFEATSFVTIWNESYAMCRDRLLQNDIQLNIFGLNEKNIIDCQKVSISQVLINFINNSCDALVDNENIKDKWIKVKLKTDNNIFEIRIEDAGPGIKSSVRDKIMRPFFTTKPSDQGTGLGLSISTQIINAHEGKIFIDDDVENTCFVIQLPLKHEKKMGQKSGKDAA